jgi:hypothetical protein
VAAVEERLPDTPTTDLVVEDNALAIGTHGRGFYVLDDIAALRQFGSRRSPTSRCSSRPTRRAASIGRSSRIT